MHLRSSKNCAMAVFQCAKSMIKMIIHNQLCEINRKTRDEEISDQSLILATRNRTPRRRHRGPGVDHGNAIQYSYTLHCLVPGPKSYRPEDAFVDLNFSQNLMDSRDVESVDECHQLNLVSMYKESIPLIGKFLLVGLIERKEQIIPTHNLTIVENG